MAARRPGTRGSEARPAGGVWHAGFLVGAAVGAARTVFKWNKAHAPLKRTVDLNHVGGAALYLLSDLSGGVTGEIHFVDSGFNVIGMPPTADLNGWTPPENGQEHPDGRADT